MQICFIKSEEALPLRHALLRPKQPLEASRYPGDDMAPAFHLGAFSGEDLIGIASFYLQPLPGESGEKVWRLRGMAVSPDHQRKGVGRDLIGRGLEELKKRDAGLLWCNARVSALQFYQALGFETVGEAFELPEIGWHYVMSIKLGNPPRIEA